MKLNKRVPVQLLSLILLLPAYVAAQQASIEYPETKKTDSVNVYFGVEVEDPYQWLEDDNSEETGEWVKSQNEITFDYLNSIPFREEIRSKVEKLINYTRASSPDKHGDYYYYFKNDGLQDQSVYYRTRNLDDASEELFLDPNTFSEDGTVAIAGTSFSKDGSLMTYLVSDGGSDWRKAITIDTGTGEVVDDTLKNIKFSGISWRGNDGFYYNAYDRVDEGDALTAANQHHKVYYHRLGTPQSDDELVFGEKIKRRFTGTTLTEDERFLAIQSSNGTSGNDLLVKDLQNPGNGFVTLVDNMHHDHRVIHSDDNRLLIFTNLDAPNYRVVAATLDYPEPDSWQELIPESANAMVSASTAGGYLFVEYLVDAKSAVRQFTFDGDLVRSIELPGIGSAGGFNGKSEERELFYNFQSYTTPGSIYRYHIETGESKLFKQPEVAFNPDDYTTEQVFYTSKDGTEVPMFIVHKKDLRLDGMNPTMLYGYGGFNISLTPSYSSKWVSWLELGGVLAVPNLRGGGEYGEEWHEAGIRMNKQNVFDDFIAAAEFLISNSYTKSENLAIAGGSNGGLLVGAVMTQRPELAGVALPAVGVMDMLRYHKFTIGAAWASDYGRSDDSEEMFRYLYGYSPYHNLQQGVEYPATLVTTADHDDRVVPAHSFKFAARLQECHNGQKPVLIRIETRAGHGAGTPTGKLIDQITDLHAFTLYNMPLKPKL